jgi:ligand-binding SRPBCC domain-containing protein
MTRVLLTTEIAAPPERCFDLSRSVTLHERSMQHTGERAVGGVTQGLLALGDTVTWSARHFWVERKLTTRITEYQPYRRFIDEQTSGPFRSLRHVHEFDARPAGTVMRDDFTYTIPFGILGALFDFLVLRRYMLRLLETRNATIKQIAESERRTAEILALP